MHNNIFLVAWQPAAGIWDGKWDLSIYLVFFSGSIRIGDAMFRLINV